MEAKKKALELMQRFNEPTQQWDEVDGFIPHKHNAKTCALIAVQEIINSNPHSNPLTTEVYSTMLFWNDVKQEIEKL